MEVKQIMVNDVKTCRPQDSLNAAAQTMWDHACGSVPVVDEQFRPVGFLTDRDICMATYTQGGSLHALRVDSAMSRQIVFCHGDDEIVDAARIMSENGVRRLLVVNVDGKLIGLLSIDDLACESRRNIRGGMNRELAGLVADVYGSICSTRCRRRHSPDAPSVACAHLSDD
ncbi:MAG: CBS domain-containing protein [Candidatus Binataceae bacterium]